MVKPHNGYFLSKKESLRHTGTPASCNGCDTAETHPPGLIAPVLDNANVSTSHASVFQQRHLVLTEVDSEVKLHRASRMSQTGSQTKEDIVHLVNFQYNIYQQNIIYINKNKLKTDKKNI